MLLFLFPYEKNKNKFRAVKVSLRNGSPESTPMFVKLNVNYFDLLTKTKNTPNILVQIIIIIIRHNNDKDV